MLISHSDHIKTYQQAWGYAEDEWVPCERCGGTAVDIHHIVYKSHGGTDDFDNLIGLCRKCHDWCHSDASRAEELKRCKRWPTENH